MTIIHKTTPIRNCTEILIINPMIKLHGYNIGHPLDDFILHNHGTVYQKFFEIQPVFGTVQYVKSGSFIFANAVIGKKKCKFNEWELVNTLKFIRDFAIDTDLLNNIAVDLYSYTTIPGGKYIIESLRKVFSRDTITVYSGTEHFIGNPCYDS